MFMDMEPKEIKGSKISGLMSMIEEKFKTNYERGYKKDKIHRDDMSRRDFEEHNKLKSNMKQANTLKWMFFINEAG